MKKKTYSLDIITELRRFFNNKRIDLEMCKCKIVRGILQRGHIVNFPYTFGKCYVFYKVNLVQVTYVSSDATLGGVLLPIMLDTIAQRGISKINKHRGGTSLHIHTKYCI